jgi:hypothetical protein
MNDLPGQATSTESLPELPDSREALSIDKTSAADEPQRGDILIRALKNQRFTLLDVVTTKFLSGPFEGFPAAAAAARARNARMIWQQNVDERGRALGDPFVLPDHA